MAASRARQSWLWTPTCMNCSTGGTTASSTVRAIRSRHVAALLAKVHSSSSSSSSTSAFLVSPRSSSGSSVGAACFA